MLGSRKRAGFLRVGGGGPWLAVVWRTACVRVLVLAVPAAATSAARGMGRFVKAEHLT